VLRSPADAAKAKSLTRFKRHREPHEWTYDTYAVSSSSLKND
jgi:hypothetical protein